MVSPFFFLNFATNLLFKTKNMFDKQTYIRRRTELKQLVGKGIIVLFGNNEAPCNYPANAYADLESAVTIKPSYALAYYYMGDLLFRKGETDQALGMLVRSKELASQYVPTYELMGDMLAVP